MRPSEALLSNDRIPDFSFAGYRMGMQPPRLPAVVDAKRFGVRADGVTDDSRALRAALDATRDGALVLPAGRIVLGDAVRITRSRVVLRGQGPDKTVLVAPKSLWELHPPGDPSAPRYYGFVEARGTLRGAKLGDVAAPARRGERTLELSAAVAIRAGELVRLRMGNAEALLRVLLGGREPGPQTPRDYEHYVDWATPVERVDGVRVILARPLRVDVRPEWGAEIVAFQPTVEDVGVEDLAFEFPGTPRRRFDEEGFSAIYVRDVANAWVRNVIVTDADNGIELEGCRFCRVEAVRLRAAVRGVPSGHHALWAKESQDCVFADFAIETQFDDEVTVEAFSNGNVFMRGVAEAMGLDHHRNAPYENLFTDLDVGSPARLWKSGGDAARGPHAGVRETLWNVRHRGHPPALPGALHFDKPDAGWPELNLVRVDGYAPTGAGDTWIEPAPDAPPNLYEAQRRRR